MTPIAVTVLQAAEMLGCKRRQVFRLLDSGVLERAPRYGRTQLIYLASIHRALLPETPKSRKRRAPRVGEIPVARAENIPL